MYLDCVKKFISVIGNQYRLFPQLKRLLVSDVTLLNGTWKTKRLRGYSLLSLMKQL